MNGKTDEKLRGDIARVVLLAAFFFAIAFLLQRPDLRKILFDMDTLRSVLKGGEGTSGYLMSALVFTLAGGGLIALGFPRLWASAVGGIIYGAFMGTILSVMASLLGASVLYQAGKTLFSAVVERRVGDRLKVWQVRFRENAFWWVLYARFFPFSNSTVMSLLCGSCNVPFTAYLLGSLVGFVPLAVVFAAFGSGGAKGNLWQIGFATALLVLSIFSRRLMNRWFPSSRD
ncbi:MAG: VTT domain-containing protein [Syntrophaceae bacterium]|nr:VTT domain-containing protein [Deltaproteobacteria bacterium]